MNIQALIYDGFDELDVIGVYEPLRMAGFNVALLSLHGQKMIKTAHGLRIHDDDIVTAGGITSSLDLGLWLIKRFAGQHKTNEISKLLEFEARSPV
jgi:putative intracellular protease/amidase